jgi:hypothetical protein
MLAFSNEMKMHTIGNFIGKFLIMRSNPEADSTMNNSMIETAVTRVVDKLNLVLDEHYRYTILVTSSKGIIGISNIDNLSESKQEDFRKQEEQIERYLDTLLGPFFGSEQRGPDLSEAESVKLITFLRTACPLLKWTSDKVQAVDWIRWCFSAGDTGVEFLYGYRGVWWVMGNSMDNAEA